MSGLGVNTVLFLSQLISFLILFFVLKRFACDRWFVGMRVSADGAFAVHRAEGGGLARSLMEAERRPAEYSVVLLLMLLFSPMSSKPHFCIMLLPAFCIERSAVREGQYRRGARRAAACRDRRSALARRGRSRSATLVAPWRFLAFTVVPPSMWGNGRGALVSGLA